MKTPVERLSLRKRLALEVFRKMRENQKAMHPLRQLSGSVRSGVMSVASIAAVTVKVRQLFLICLRQIFCV